MSLLPHFSPALERRLLQIAIALAGCVPATAGLAGALAGPAILGAGDGGGALQSHYRYLSGLLLGLGLTFWTTIPRIERAAGTVRLLTSLVVIGGVARLFGLALATQGAGHMIWALGMELGVTPLLCLWQGRIAKRRA